MFKQRIKHYILAADWRTLKMPRIEPFKEKIIEHYAEDTRQRAEVAKYQYDAIISSIAQTDPTPNKEYLIWLCRLYANKSIKRFEDIAARAKPALKDYVVLKNRKAIPIAYRDINKFVKFSDFEDFIDQFADKQAGFTTEESIAIEKRLFANGDAELVGQKRECRVVEIGSYDAAMFYGRGTKWCTAAEDKYDNAYDAYKNGLFVLFVGSTKYQLHFENYQLQDEKDDDVYYPEFVKKYPEFIDILDKEATRYKSIMFRKHPSDKDCIAALSDSYTNIQYITDQSEPVQLCYIRKASPSRICAQHIHDPKSSRVVDALLQKWPEAIDKIKNPTEEQQLNAVYKYPGAIVYINNPSEKVQKAALISFVDRYETRLGYHDVMEQLTRLYKLIKHPTTKTTAYYNQLLRHYTAKQFREQNPKDGSK